MNWVPFFLNEKSYPIVGDQRAVNEAVLSLLHGLRKAKKTAQRLRLAAMFRLDSVQITADHQTLASLTLVMDREWWRFVGLLEQYSPFDSIPQCLPPTQHGEGEDVSEASLWSLQNQAFVASFSSAGRWGFPVIEVHVCNCTTGTHDAIRHESVRNISEEAHAEHWARQLENFGVHQSGSSEVYSGGEFSLKMYLLDHEPPHVHVFVADLGHRCVAKIRFDVEAEILENEGLKGAMRSTVLRFINAHRDQLTRSWERCRAGELPNRIV